MAMMRPAYLSAFRNLRANADPVMPPPVSGPTGATTSTTIQAGGGGGGGSSIEEQVRAFLARANAHRMTGSAPQQAQALQGMGLTSAEQDIVRGGYAKGGFEGVRSAVNENAKGLDWYDIPSWQRTAILSGARE